MYVKLRDFRKGPLWGLEGGQTKKGVKSAIKGTRLT